MVQEVGHPQRDVVEGQGHETEDAEVGHEIVTGETRRNQKTNLKAAYLRE